VPDERGRERERDRESEREFLKQREYRDFSGQLY
jgi:hypothetical protein